MSADFLYACELHDAARIAELVDGGLDPGVPIDGKPPLTWLIEMYTRSDAFPDCVRALLSRGAVLDDPRIAPVLLNDRWGIQQAATADPAWLRHRTTLPSAFTPLDDATLLHVAAEYGHVAAARTLLTLGAEVDAPAGLDADGLGGHTPLFHTVSSHDNRSAAVMELLLDAGASAETFVHGLVWGRGFEWETTLFDLTPVAYAQCGLLPQMHRDARQIADVVRRLLAAAGRPAPALRNVPNRYVVRAERQAAGRRTPGDV